MHQQHGFFFVSRVVCMSICTDCRLVAQSLNCEHVLDTVNHKNDCMQSTARTRHNKRLWKITRHIPDAAKLADEVALCFQKQEASSGRARPSIAGGQRRVSQQQVEHISEEAESCLVVGQRVEIDVRQLRGLADKLCKIFALCERSCATTVQQSFG